MATQLLIYEAFPGFNRVGRGTRLFQDGKPSSYFERLKSRLATQSPAA